MSLDLPLATVLGDRLLDLASCPEGYSIIQGAFPSGYPPVGQCLSRQMAVYPPIGGMPPFWCNPVQVWAHLTAQEWTFDEPHDRSLAAYVRRAWATGEEDLTALQQIDEVISAIRHRLPPLSDPETAKVLSEPLPPSFEDAVKQGHYAFRFVRVRPDEEPSEDRCSPNWTAAAEMMHMEQGDPVMLVLDVVRTFWLQWIDESVGQTDLGLGDASLLPDLPPETLSQDIQL